MDEAISKRLLDQRLRNRMMEQLECLAEWEGTLRWGAAEYFNSFFDWFPDRPPLYPNSALTDRERAVLTDVLNAMDAAAEGTSRDVDEAELISAGWPARIKPIAQGALGLMMQRGRFSEEVEEEEPSGPGGWPNDG